MMRLSISPNSPFHHPLRVVGASIAMLLAGCASPHTPYRPPAADVPAQFTHADTNAASLAIDGQWWRQFGDPQLDALIDEALRRNNDLAAAAIKVRRAQLQAGISADNLMPQLSATASAGYDRKLHGGRGGGRSNSANAGISYELDLWGRLGSLNDAAQWEALATEQDRESAALTLIGTTAGLYWQAANLNRRIGLGEQSIAYAEKTLALVKVQYSAGAVSALEWLEARQNVATQRADQIQLRQQQMENDNALAILFDGPPRAMRNIPAQSLDYPLPAPVAGVPAEVLARRPDVRAAEQRLRSILADADATRASYYPKFTLTGGVGSGSDSLRQVLQHPVASAGLALALPFLQWRQMQLNNKIAQADYEFAVVNFRQSLYKALSEVEDTLSARMQYAQQGVLLKQKLDAARQAERLYDLRYRAGSVALSVFLDAQEKRRSVEIAAANNRLDTLNNQMKLYRVLGGSDRQDGAPPRFQR
jgi:NodT family efflux transporter outer membrane factor (OMF) lipoprotein